MKYRNFLLLTGAFFLVQLYGCTKDDNEPMLQSIISRLYVSNSDTDAAVANTLIFDPADRPSFEVPYSFNSQLPDANGILFDPFSGTVFQVSRKNKNVRTFKVNTDGTLANKNSFIDEGLISARAMAFDRSKNIHYIASNTDSAIYVYDSANTLTGAITANKKLKLNGQPWDIHLINDRLFVVIDQDRTEVQLFENASSLIIGTIVPAKKLTIQGASRLHGISYSATRDAMILTGTGDLSSGAFNTDGAIYIVEEVNERFTEEGTAVIPDRTIKGPATGLGNPVDVAWDDREGKDLIYIAEKGNRKILVFTFADNGNIEPALSYSLDSSPEALYLDAR